jgi:Lipase (class 3)
VAVDRSQRLIVVSFRGTQTISDVVTDLDLGLGPTDVCGTAATGCRAHSGYVRSWEDSRQQVITTVQDALANNQGFTVVTTGHSLGAGVASVAGVQLRTLGMAVDIVSLSHHCFILRSLRCST